MGLIQVRSVPDDVHRALKARAALEGRSLSAVVLDELRRVAESPSLDEVTCMRRTYSSSSVASALRRLANRGFIDRQRAELSFHAARALIIVQHEPAPFLDRMWQLLAAMSSYDAMHVALAEVLDVPLSTCDLRLARAHGHAAHHGRRRLTAGWRTFACSVPRATDPAAVA